MTTQTQAAQTPLVEQHEPHSPFVDVLLRTMKNPQAKIGVGILTIIILGAVLADLVAPYGAREQQEGARLLSPSLDHLMGTDEIGRDIFSRVLFGLRASLIVSVVGVSIGASLGAFTGFLAGYVGGLFETIAMRVVDTLLAFPSLLTGIVIVTILGPGLRSVAIAIAVFNFPAFVRLSRAGAIAEGAKDYVLAARSMGASSIRVLYRHIAINAVSPLVVQIALSYAFAVLAEASLSFLGLGVQPPDPSLGTLKQRGRGFLHQQIWYAVAPGTVLALMLVSFNFLADSFNEANDPKNRR
jgi:peptide/nickel transport system permease protein